MCAISLPACCNRNRNRVVSVAARRLPLPSAREWLRTGRVSSTKPTEHLRAASFLHHFQQHLANTCHHRDYCGACTILCNRPGMAETQCCIVCLGDLRETLATLNDNEPGDLPEHARADAGDDGVQQHHHGKSLGDTKLSTKRYQHHLLTMLQATDRNATLVAFCSMNYT
jgi:hypothetical protein